jgi:hypothetical protein
VNRDTALWFGLLTGPVIWLTSFLINFALVPWTCVWQAKPSLYIVSAVAFLISAGAGLLCWNQWQAAGRELPDDSNVTPNRARLMAMGGLGLNGISCLVIIGQVIAEAGIGVCE